MKKAIKYFDQAIEKNQFFSEAYFEKRKFLL